MFKTVFSSTVSFNAFNTVNPLTLTYANKEGSKIVSIIKKYNAINNKIKGKQARSRTLPSKVLIVKQ